MSSVVNGEFFLGETWNIDGQVCDYQGDPEDMTGGKVMFRMESFEGVLVLDLSTPADGSITNATSGSYSFVVSPAAQAAANVAAIHYKYEIKAVTGANVSSVQNVGTIRVNSSLFSNT